MTTERIREVLEEIICSKRDQRYNLVKENPHFWQRWIKKDTVEFGIHYWEESRSDFEIFPAIFCGEWKKISLELKAATVSYVPDSRYGLIVLYGEKNIQHLENMVSQLQLETGIPFYVRKKKKIPTIDTYVERIKFPPEEDYDLDNYFDD